MLHSHSVVGHAGAVLGARLTNTKWSTPTLKARWFDDESIEALDEGAEGSLVAKNTMKVGHVDVAVDSLSVQAFFDRFSVSPDEPASG